MTLDGLLTLLALIAAVYAVAPTVSHLRLRLHGRFLLWSSAFAFVLVLYFEFFSAVALPCPGLLGSYCELITITEASISANQLAFLVTLVWAIGVGLAFWRSTLSPGALPALAQLVSELEYEGRFGELLKLVDPQLDLVERAARRRLRLARLHDYFARFDPRSLPMHEQLRELHAQINGNRSRQFTPGLRRRALSRLSAMVPSQKGAELAAVDILRTLLQSPKLTAFIASCQPKFALKLLSFDVRGVHEFCADFLTNLIASPDSELYRQIKDNQNVSSVTGYYFPEHNYLLAFFFRDAEIANRLNVWHPIGEYVLSELRVSKDPEYTRYLNGPANFFEEERWRDRTFVGIRFFDLMVSAAERQGIRWHMWLYYYTYFVEELVKLHNDSASEIDRYAEWPTRGLYLIYRIFDAVRGWIEAFKYLPSNSPYRALRAHNSLPDNGNIPESAAVAFARCLNTLLQAPNVSERFKNYIYGIALQLIAELSEQADKELRACLIRTIVEGGMPHRDSEEYHLQLRKLFDESDHVLKGKLRDYAQALQ